MRMQMRGYAAALAAAALTIAGPATAQAPSSADYSDARCFLVFTILPERLVDGKPVSQEQRAAMDSVASYFLGRLAARSPSLDLGTVMTPAIIRDVQGNLPAQFESCVAGTDALMAAMVRSGTLVEEAMKAP